MLMSVMACACSNFTTQRDAGSVRGGLHDTHHGMDSATDDDDEDVSGAEDDQYIHHHQYASVGWVRGWGMEARDDHLLLLLP